MGGITDTIADYLTQVRNASNAHKESVTITRGSKMMIEITELLKREGFVKNYKVVEEGPKKSIRIHLKYRPNSEPAIQKLVRISRPGLRRYCSSDEIPRVLGGLGCSILSTSKGIVTDRQARSQKLGGELLCNVW